MIAICHEEKEFAERLADYLNEHALLPLSAIAFSEKGKFTRFANKHPHMKKVLPEEWGTRMTKEEKKGVMFFCEEKEKEEEGMYVYRFRSADGLAERIRELAGLKMSDRRTEGKTRYIGIYSPVGRCLKTTFSLTLGQMLAKKHRVLYLNFENYSGFDRMLGLEKPSDMSDLLLYFLNRREDLRRKMQEMTVILNGLEMIPPALSYLDLESISGEDWERFFDLITDIGCYDYVLLDMSDYIKGVYEILLRCAYIYTFAPEDGLALAKVSQYEQILTSLNYGEVLQKTRKVTPPVFHRLPIRPEELLHSELAEYTKKITEDDFHWSRQ